MTDTAALLADAARRASSYLESLHGRAVTPSPAAVAALPQLDVPLPAAGSDPAETLAELDRRISPATMAMAGPRFFGFVIGGALPATLAASVLATAWDQCSSKWAVTPGTAAVERVALRWVLEALGLPRESGGGFVTGATTATFTALAAARHSVLARQGWDVEARGLVGAPADPGRGRGRGPCERAEGAGHAGPRARPGVPRPGRRPGPDAARGAPRARWARHRLLAGRQREHRRLRSGRARDHARAPGRARGCTSTARSGSGPRPRPRRAHLVAGLERADSWATDAHKWLNVPYDSGLVLVRDEAALRAAMGTFAAYLPESGVRDPADATPELSRRARGVEVWAALRTLGAVRARRPRRALLRPRAALRRRPGGRRSPRAQRGGPEPGAGLVRRRGADAARHRGRPAGRHLLVRRHGVAGPRRHAHQRLELGDDRGRRGALAWPPCCAPRALERGS